MRIESEATTRRAASPFFFLLCSFVLLLTGCIGPNAKDNSPAPRPYRLSGRIYQDSLHVDSIMNLWVDQHGVLKHLVLPVSRGAFSWQGETNSIDELRLFDARGHHWKMYAGGEWELEVEIDSLYRLIHLGSDTINPWLSEMQQHIEAVQSVSYCTYLLDSLCHADTASLRNALLVFESLPLIRDSLAVRRLQWSFAKKTLPDWWVEKVDQYLDANSHVESGRIPQFNVVTPDTTFQTHEIGRTGKLFFFWAEWDSVSVDSLRSLPLRVSRDFGLYDHKPHVSKHPKRMEIVSVCCSATDSARWKELTHDVPGLHALYPAGLSDPNVRRWRITTLPYTVVIDAYGNIYGEGVWGENLNRQLSRFSDILPSRK